MTYLEGIIRKTLCLLREKAEGERGDDDFKTLDLEAGRTVVVSLGREHRSIDVKISEARSFLCLRVWEFPFASFKTFFYNDNDKLETYRKGGVTLNSHHLDAPVLHKLWRLPHLLHMYMIYL